jgi:septal ring factor EnvC (AmiA/AmiB activator)
MNSDDLTRDMAENEAANPTQPTITAVFRLLNEVKVQVENLNTRLDAIDTRLDAIDTRLDAIDTRLDAIDARLDTFNARLDQVESRLARDIEGVNTRVTEGFRELSNKIDALNRSRLQTEADYFGLHQRVTDLESKAS